MTAAQPILVGLIALGLAARPAMVQGATPISGPTTITAPGSYVVTANFQGSILINASHVDLNLMGHTITVFRGYRSTAVGVANGATNVSIENGTVAGQRATFGILLSGGGGCSVSNMTITGITGTAIYFSDGGGDVISGNTCLNNNYAMYVTSPSNTITGNVCKGNNAGIDVGSNGNTIENNTALNNLWIDLADANPTCGSNLWAGNTFHTASQSCIH
jgi:parallel beta-helix repeat protein